MPKKLTIVQIKEKIKDIHGDSVVLCEETYVGTQVLAKFIHNVHGEWWIKPTFVLQGKSHRNVGYSRRAKSQTLDVKEIVKRVKAIHGDTVKLIEETYIDTHTMCKFTQEGFGEFSAYPQHIYVRGDSHPDGRTKKKEKNNVEKHGVPYPLQRKEIKEKHKNTIINRYGVENISQLEKIKEKKKETCLKNHGVEHILQSDIFKNIFREKSIK